jgi:hypothetical protein
MQIGAEKNPVCEVWSGMQGGDWVVMVVQHGVSMRRIGGRSWIGFSGRGRGNKQILNERVSVSDECEQRVLL